MGLKTILFLLIVVHACTGESGSGYPPYEKHNGNFGGTWTDGQTVFNYSLDQEPFKPPIYKSLSAIAYHILDEYQEVISREEQTDLTSPNNPSKVTAKKYIIKENASPIFFSPKMKPLNTAHLSNNTDLEAVKLNKTTQNLMAFFISGDAVLFLKGLLVTRVMPFFYIFLLVSLPLNALALVTFTCKIKEKKPAVIYMSNLACVDLLFTLLLPLKIHYHLNGSDWVFGEVACRVLSAAFYCYMYCSILLMMCMSVDRLLAVVLPFASLTWRNSRNCAYICALVWLMAIAGTVPILSIRQTFKIENVGITCHEALLHEDHVEQTYMNLFSILSCVYFFLPLVITLACYSSIIYVLRVKSGQLATSSSSSDKLKKAVIMTIATMTEFVFCFAPANAILLYHCVVLATGGITGEGNASYMAYMLAVCAGSSSVFLDPLLYYYGSSQCKKKIKSVFWWKKAKATLSNSDSLTKCSHMSCEYSQARITVFGNKANDMLGK